MNAYGQGFIDKCNEYGIDANELVKQAQLPWGALAGGAARIGSKILPKVMSGAKGLFGGGGAVPVKGGLQTAMSRPPIINPETGAQTIRMKPNLLTDSTFRGSQLPNQPKSLVDAETGIKTIKLKRPEPAVSPFRFTGMRTQGV